MPSTHDFLDRFKAERAEALRQIELLSSGTMRVEEGNGSVPPLDTTAKWIEFHRKDLADLNEVIARLERK